MNSGYKTVMLSFVEPLHVFAVANKIEVDLNDPSSNWETFITIAGSLIVGALALIGAIVSAHIISDKQEKGRVRDRHEEALERRRDRTSAEKQKKLDLEAAYLQKQREAVKDFIVEVSILVAQFQRNIDATIQRSMDKIKTIIEEQALLSDNITRLTSDYQRKVKLNEATIDDERELAFAVDFTKSQYIRNFDKIHACNSECSQKICELLQELLTMINSHFLAMRLYIDIEEVTKYGKAIIYELRARVEELTVVNEIAFHVMSETETKAVPFQYPIEMYKRASFYIGDKLAPMAEAAHLHLSLRYESWPEDRGTTTDNDSPAAEEW